MSAQKEADGDVFVRVGFNGDFSLGKNMSNMEPQHGYGYGGYLY